MRDICYFVIVTGIVLALGESNYTSAYAKTVESGDTSASWNGSGEILDLGNGDQVIHGMVKATMIARHKGEAKTIVHSSKLVCPVRVTQNRKKDYQTIDALCTVVAHEGKDVGYAHWNCVGTLKECEGEFVMTGGIGGFSGISGTTPFKTSIIFEVQEGKNAQAIGYAQWPNMTYTLP
jgi:hypothetical protein